MDVIWGALLAVVLFGGVFVVLYLAYRKSRRNGVSYDLSALQMGQVPGAVEISRQAKADAQLPAPSAVAAQVDQPDPSVSRAPVGPGSRRPR